MKIVQTKHYPDGWQIIRIKITHNGWSSYDWLMRWRPPKDGKGGKQ